MTETKNDSSLDYVLIVDSLLFPDGGSEIEAERLGTERTNISMLKRIYPVFAAITFIWLAVFSSTTMAAEKIQGWKSSEVITPEQLVKLLKGKPADRPIVLQVGFGFLYDGGHIVGSIHAGPASRPDGIQKLKEAVKTVSKSRHIVIYCGCCPWVECPNIHPAFAALQKLGFKNVKALFLPVNFEHDWITKGYPVSKGSEPVSK